MLLVKAQYGNTLEVQCGHGRQNVLRTDGHSAGAARDHPGKRRQCIEKELRPGGHHHLGCMRKKRDPCRREVLAERRVRKEALNAAMKFSGHREGQGAGGPKRRRESRVEPIERGGSSTDTTSFKPSGKRTQESKEKVRMSEGWGLLLSRSSEFTEIHRLTKIPL